MTHCFFTSDLHGSTDRYEKLFNRISDETPEVVFLGGDLLPSGMFSITGNDNIISDFFNDVLTRGFLNLKKELGSKYPEVYLILGNDDLRIEETNFLKAENKGIWNYIHNRRVKFKEYYVYGYSFVPPTPFRLKDWERYDVSRYVDPGCIPLEEGIRSVSMSLNEIKYSTIEEDINLLVNNHELSNSIFLFHTPPYKTKLDKIGIEPKIIDHVPMDTHVGSIAVKRFIERKQPLITLHGHIHESARLTGQWHDRIGNTVAFSAAHDGPELSLIKFDAEAPDNYSRELI